MSIGTHYGKTYINGMLRQLSMMGFLDKVVDVGAGDGAYSELMQGDLPDDSEWSAVEKSEENIENNNLKNLYTEIFNEDIPSFDFKKVAEADLVIFGDIFEFVEKEDAIKLGQNSLEKCKGFMISLPISTPSILSFAVNPLGVQLKGDWRHEEVLETFPEIVSFVKHGHIGVYFGTKDDELKTFLPMLHKKVVPLFKAAYEHDVIETS